MIGNAYSKYPLPSSRLTEIRKNRMIYADYISKVQGNNQGCDTARTGLESGEVAPGSILPQLLDGARNTTVEERDSILASTTCPVVAPAPAPAPIVYEVVQDGLNLYYDVGNASSYSGSGTSIFDLSPNGYTGTLVNGITYDSGSGGSLVFNGTNSYIDTNQSLASEEFTLMAWVKSSNTTNFQMVFSKEAPAGLPWNYRMFLYQTTGYLLGDIAKAGSSAAITFSQNLVDGTWHFIAFSRKLSTDKISLYIDGNLVNQTTDTMAAGTIQNSQEVWIGFSAFSGGSYPFDGNIASAFIYNRPLTDDEVFTNFMATKNRFGL